MNKEYAGIDGVPDFTDAAAKLAFCGDSPVIKDSLVFHSLLFWGIHLVITLTVMLGIQLVITLTVMLWNKWLLLHSL